MPAAVVDKKQVTAPKPSGSRPAEGRQKGPALPPSRTMIVHSADGTRLHTEVFGPANGYPIVLAHGITCSLKVWHEQINDLSRDFRVIAYDHRGHGRSGVPAPSAYSLDHLAADLDAVLAAVLRPGERAVLAGHSMGGIAISAWSDRFRQRVAERVDAVALINTTHGNLLDKIQLLRLPGVLRSPRIAAAGVMIRSLGGAPLFLGAQPGSRRFIQLMALGADADPALSHLLHDIFAATAPAGRGAWARALVEELGPKTYIDLSGLTVPALVVGSTKDRLLPICRSRKIADAVPNLIEMVEIPGGHCAMLEHPELVNGQLRGLASAVTSAQRISS
jgi:pimeloyl-ACP methyl ester carboxylesterase